MIIASFWNLAVLRSSFSLASLWGSIELVFVSIDLLSLWIDGDLDLLNLFGSKYGEGYV